MLTHTRTQCNGSRLMRVKKTFLTRSQAACVCKPPEIYARDLRMQNVTAKKSARYSAMAAPAEQPR